MLASLGQDLTGTGQDQRRIYTCNPVQEIVGHSWTNDLDPWAGQSVAIQ